MKDFPYEKLKKIIADIERSNEEITDLYYNLMDLQSNGDFAKIFILKMWLDYLEYSIVELDSITRFLSECSECKYHKGITEDEIKKIFLRHEETMKKLHVDEASVISDAFCMPKLS